MRVPIKVTRREFVEITELTSSEQIEHDVEVAFNLENDTQNVLHFDVDWSDFIGENK